MALRGRGPGDRARQNRSSPFACTTRRTISGRIPLLIREMLPKHRLFLRAYEGDGFQTVVYAVSASATGGACGRMSE